MNQDGKVSDMVMDLLCLGGMKNITRVVSPFSTSSKMSQIRRVCLT